ncbi:hypothetical protein [Sphingobacterium siyangense]
MKNLIILFTFLPGLGTVAAQTKNTPQGIEKKELVKDTEPSIDATVLL